MFIAQQTCTTTIDLHTLFSQAYADNCVGNTERAIHAYTTILAYCPDLAQVHHNLGYTLRVHGDLTGALKAYQRALELNPNSDAARFGLASTLLYQGNLKDGWEYYCREQLKAGPFNIDRLQNKAQNHALAGKRILLQHQGGLGDTMMFLRYVAELKQQGASTIVLIPTVLKPLLMLCPYIDTIVTNGAPLPAYDEHISLMGLPLLFPDYENTVPTKIPYLFADSALQEEWNHYFTNNCPHGCLKIGICWTADLKNDESRPHVAHRSVPLEELAPLRTFTTIRLYSLQKDTSELARAPYINSFGASFDTTHGAFMDSAAIMKNLDLVITVDTSVAHLAGALGVPIWLLLPYSVDWRWTAQRTDSLWYPTMRIFKQQTPLNWKPVINNIVTALHELLQKQHPQNTGP